TGVEITATDVTTAAWSKTVTFSRSDTRTGSVSDTISLAWTRREVGALRLRITVRQHPRIRWDQQRIRIQGRRHRQRRVLDLRWLRIRRYDLRPFKRRLRSLTKRSGFGFFTSAAATAARSFLFWLTAATATFIKSGRTRVGCRLLVRNIEHLLNLKLFI